MVVADGEEERTIHDHLKRTRRALYPTEKSKRRCRRRFGPLLVDFYEGAMDRLADVEWRRRRGNAIKPCRVGIEDF